MHATSDPCRLSLACILQSTRGHGLACRCRARVSLMTLKCFHQLFEAQFAAGMATDTIAVEFGDDVVTYDAFNRSANRLAHHLMACGIGPDCPVGLSMARSPEIFTSMMAIA